MKPDKFEEKALEIVEEFERCIRNPAIEHMMMEKIAHALREASSVSLPSEKEIDNIAHGIGQGLYIDMRLAADDPQKNMLITVHAAGAKAMWRYLKSQCQPTKKKDWCPCGGIILADTEDFRTPLCPNCYDETRSNTKEPLEALSNADMYEQLYKAFCVTSKELSEMEPSEAKDVLYKIECGATAWRAAEARLLKK